MNTSSERSSSESDLVIAKLGGSLITDKRGDGAARVEVIERLAREIAAALPAMSEGLVIGHGSGSFGHVAAERHGLGGGLRREAPDAPLIGAGVTQDAAARLHRIVIGALVDAGVPVISIAPSSSFLADRGHIVESFLPPLFTAVDAGFVPVIYGDVLVDRSWAASICSTEMAVDALVEATLAAVGGLQVSRLLWLGATDGIYDRGGSPVASVDGENYDEVRRLIDAPAGTDVTGGMLLRLETARSQALLGIESWIFDGRRVGALETALRGHDAGGTRIAPAPRPDRH